LTTGTRMAQSLSLCTTLEIRSGLQQSNISLLTLVPTGSTVGIPTDEETI
jgi:hypothetical protein